MKTTFATPAQRKSVKRSKKKVTKSSSAEPLETKPTGEKPWDEVRKDKVARARKLLQDANYPSPEVIRSVADLLARDWDGTKHS